MVFTRNNRNSEHWGSFEAAALFPLENQTMDKTGFPASCKRYLPEVMINLKIAYQSNICFEKWLSVFAPDRVICCPSLALKNFSIFFIFLLIFYNFIFSWHIVHHFINGEVVKNQHHASSPSTPLIVCVCIVPGEPLLQCSDTAVYHDFSGFDALVT